MSTRRLDFAEFYRVAKDECLFTVLVSVGDRDAAQELVADFFPRADELEQVTRVLQFRGQLTGRGLLTSSYEGLDDFEAKVRVHLTQIVRRWPVDRRPAATTPQGTGSLERDRNLMSSRLWTMTSRALTRVTVSMACCAWPGSPEASPPQMTGEAGRLR